MTEGAERRTKSKTDQFAEKLIRAEVPESRCWPFWRKFAQEMEDSRDEALKVAGESEEFALRCIAADEVIIIKRLKEIDRLRGEWEPSGLEKREAIALEVNALEERVKRSREWLAALERIRNQSKP